MSVSDYFRKLMESVAPHMREYYATECEKFYDTHTTTDAEREIRNIKDELPFLKRYPASIWMNLHNIYTNRAAPVKNPSPAPSLIQIISTQKTEDEWWVDLKEKANTVPLVLNTIYMVLAMASTTHNIYQISIKEFVSTKIAYVLNVVSFFISMFSGCPHCW